MVQFQKVLIVPADISVNYLVAAQNARSKSVKFGTGVNFTVKMIAGDAAFSK